MFIDMEEEVVYMEEQHECGDRGPRRRDESARTRSLRAGFDDTPVRRIFGATPLQKAHQDLEEYTTDFNFDADDYSSSQGSVLPTVAPISCTIPIHLTSHPLAEQQTPRTLPSHQTPSGSGLEKKYLSDGEFTNRSSAPLSAGGSKDSVYSARRQSQQLDRPAHWGGPTSARKPVTVSGKKRSSAYTQHRHTEFSSQPIYSNSYSSLRKPPVATRVPASLDRVSFQPSWLKSKTPIVSAGPKQMLKDDIDSQWHNDTEDDVSLAPNREYDRIDDLSNSLDPHVYVGGLPMANSLSVFDTSRVDHSQCTLIAPISPPRRIVEHNDEFDTPIKSGKRKLKQYGALLKKVMNAEEGKNMRWLNLHNDGSLHCNHDPIRYDLNDPRCGSTVCMDVRVLNCIENLHLKMHHGLELLELEVHQLLQRSPNSVSFFLTSPQELNINQVCNSNQNKVSDFGPGDSSENAVIQIKPTSRLLGLFRSDTVQLLNKGSQLNSLVGATLRVFDYMIIVHPDRPSSRQERSVVEGVNDTIRLLCTRLVELRKEVPTC